MAFAIASGARPENGLFTAIVAGLEHFFDKLLALLHLPGVATLGSAFGAIPRGLPVAE